MKKVVVTGASSGIGKAISERLLSINYQVIGISRSITNKHLMMKISLPFKLIYQMKKKPSLHVEH